jgi:hypothetical protein
MLCHAARLCPERERVRAHCAARRDQHRSCLKPAFCSPPTPSRLVPIAPLVSASSPPCVAVQVTLRARTCASAFGNPLPPLPVCRTGCKRFWRHNEGCHHRHFFSVSRPCLASAALLSARSRCGAVKDVGSLPCAALRRQLVLGSNTLPPVICLNGRQSSARWGSRCCP